METYTNSSSSSSRKHYQYKNDMNYDYNYSVLHSVRKTIAKPGKKLAVAPQPPIRPRVYKVDPIDFRDLVQKLTGAAISKARVEDQSGSNRLQLMAPPPLNVVEKGAAVLGQALQTPKSKEGSSVHGGLMDQSSFLALNMSPNTYNWASTFPLLSPGTFSLL